MTLRNLAVVFLLTGIWHGASWNYIIWGCLNGVFVLLERICQDKPLYRKTPKFIKYTATMLIVMICWQFFRFEDMSKVWDCWSLIFGSQNFGPVTRTWEYIYDARLVTQVVIGILGATVLGSACIHTWYGKVKEIPWVYALQEVFLLLLLCVSILFMVNSTYSPFLYFQY